MLYPVCPTCGALLCNIQLPYQEDIRNLCIKYNIDIELMSRGIIYNDGFNEEKKKILDKYIEVDNICCRSRLPNFSDIVRLVN